MRAIKDNPAPRANPSTGKSAVFAVLSAPLAQKLTFTSAGNHSPSEFAGLLREKFGILVSVRWVQMRCQRGEIATIRVPYFGRRLIPATEAARFAASFEKTTGGRT
jgi:hypothetical protein